MSSDRFGDGTIGRRGVILGAGSAALVAGSGLTNPAAAAQPMSQGDGVAPSGDGTVPSGDGVAAARVAAPEGSPITTTIASAPVSGFIYRTVSMYDFVPFYPASQRTWGGSGIYTAGTSGPVRATVEIPPGALVRDVEYYVYNNSGSDVFPDTYLYVAGSGSLASIGASVAVPSGSAITAMRVVVPPTGYGAYPLASRVLVSLTTPTTATVQINGARVGFSQGSGGVGMFDTPIRAYDSRHFTKLNAGSTRTVTLTPDIVPPGATALLVNVTAVNGEAAGYLRVYSAAAAQSPASLYFKGDGKPIANWQIVGVSAARKIKVYASKRVHFVIDVTGIVS
jgi:hypothetical protein